MLWSQMAERSHVHVLFTFDFEEWEGKYDIYEADLHGKTRRVVDLLKRFEVPVTFFLDAETTLKYPEAADLLVEEGFELALHSDRHFGPDSSSLTKYDFSYQDSETQIARIESAISMIRHMIPKFDPKGFRAPGLRWNEELYISLNNMNFLYDSSQEDKFVFWPFLNGRVVVIPMNCGDYDSSCYKIGVKYVMNNWRDNYRRACQAAKEGGKSYFLLLAHPSVSGKYKYMGMLKAMINYIHWSEAEYMTCADLATEYKTGKQKGEMETPGKRKINGILRKRRTYIEEREERVKQLRKAFEDYRLRFIENTEVMRKKALTFRKRPRMKIRNVST